MSRVYDDKHWLSDVFLGSCIGYFSGKTIIPFNSHGGSGFSNTIEEIKELQPDANISDEGLSISRDKVADSVQDVTDWAKSLDLSEK